MIVTQVVRRFGQVGGMESYVWKLSHALVELGVEVKVICEECFGETPAEIDIIRVQKPERLRPRYRAMQHFRDQVERVNGQFRELGLVHSHERTGIHAVTTIHGPPMGHLLKQGSFIERRQKRIGAWSAMEYDEVLGPQVKCVVPVSSRIATDLSQIYPEIASRLSKPGWPALDRGEAIERSDFGRRLVFVGREPRRKGLDIALKAFRSVQRQSPNTTLDVFGVRPSDVSFWLRRSCDQIRFHGWVKKVPYEEYDVLIHPARYEPFGMAIVEARAAGLAVVMSDQVGAADLELDATTILGISEPISKWAASIDTAFESSRFCQAQVRFDWRDLARWYVEQVYQSGM